MCKDLGDQHLLEEKQKKHIVKTAYLFLLWKILEIHASTNVIFTTSISPAAILNRNQDSHAGNHAHLHLHTYIWATENIHDFQNPIGQTHFCLYCITSIKCQTKRRKLSFYVNEYNNMHTGLRIKLRFIILLKWREPVRQTSKHFWKIRSVLHLCQTKKPREGSIEESSSLSCVLLQSTTIITKIREISAK